MKYFTAALFLSIITSKITPNKSCEKGSDEVCQTKLNRKGVEVSSEGSCCMYFKAIKLPDTANMDSSQVAEIDRMKNFSKS